MNIGLRTATFSSITLPYDEEVEYLQVDSGVAACFVIPFRCESGDVCNIRCSTTGSDSYCFGQYGKIAWRCGGVMNNFSIVSGSISTDAICRGVCPSSNGNKYGNAIFNPLETPSNGIGFVVTVKGGLKTVWWLNIMRDGEKLIDLIPVRVGTVGYMYDKVSKSLIEQEGAGEVIVGPDVSAANGVV